MPGERHDRRASSGGHRWLRRVPTVLTALGVPFVAYTAYVLARDWRTPETPIHWALAAAALLPVVVLNLVQIQAWIAIVEHLSGTSAPAAKLRAVYAASHLARYIPGKLGLAVVRVEGSARFGIRRRTVIASVAVEMLSWAAAAGAVAAVLVAVHPPDTSTFDLRMWAVFGIVGAGAAVFLLSVIDRRRLPRLRAAVGSEGGHGPLVPWRAPVLHALVWVCWAAHGVMVAVAFGGAAGGAIASSWCFVAAPLAGVVMVMAPAGLGVREATIALGLSALIGPVPAVAAAVASRLESLTADVLVWMATGRLAIRRGESPPSPESSIDHRG